MEQTGMGTLVCELKDKQPVEAMAEQFAEHLPNFDDEMKKHEEYTECTIENAGVLPCNACPITQNAEKMILVQ